MKRSFNASRSAQLPAAAEQLEDRTLLSSFTITSPTSEGQLPNGVTEVGGIVLDMVGSNGARVVSQVPASSLFEGFANSNPLTIGTQTGFGSTVVNALGGGLSEVAVRITLFDGDTGPGEFDDNQNTLLLTGHSIGNFSDVVTQETTSDGLTVLSTNSSGGFRNNRLDTGFFYSNNSSFLGNFYNTIVSIGEVRFQLDDVDPGENFFDFTAGVDGGLVNVGQPPNVAPQINSVSSNSPINEGGQATITVNASDPDNTTGGLTYEFDFDNNGTFDLSNSTGVATHTFSEDGSFTVKVRVSDARGGTDTDTTSVIVNNVAPALSDVAVTSPISEGGVATLTGTLSDPGTQDTFTVEIDWGNGTQTITGVSAGPFSFTRQYVDDDPTGTPRDAYVINMTITDDDGGSTSLSDVGSSGSGAVIIDGGDREEHGFFDGANNRNGWKFIEQMVNFAYNGARNGQSGILVIGASGNALNAINSAASVLGLPAPTVVTGSSLSSVNFNDFALMYVPSHAGQTSGGVSTADLNTLTSRKAAVQSFINNGGSLVALTEDTMGSSAYAWLELPDRFTIARGGINPNQYRTQELINAGLVISDAELAAGTPLHNTFTGPVGFNGLTPFVYSVGPNNTAENGGGDDQVVTLGLASGSAGLGLSVTVNNVAPDLSPLSLSATSIDENGSVTVNGTFTDPGTADVHTVTIDWGDGLADAVITLPVGGRSFSATHTYLDDNPTGTPSDNYTITATVADDDTGSDSVTANVTVNNVAPQLQNVAITSPIDENDIATVTGDIIDPGTLDTFTLTVDWGDGTVETFNYAAGTTSFSETHQYLDDGASPGNGTASDVYDVTLTIADDDGATGGGGGGGRLALEAAGDNLTDTIPFAEAVLEAAGYVVDIVSGADIDTPAEINQYAAVLLGDSGHGDNDWNTFGVVLEDYVTNGGGLLASGWAPWFLSGSTGLGYDALRRLLPVGPSTAYTNTTSIVPTAVHAITDGVSTWTTASYNNYGGAVKPGATVVAEDSGGHASAVFWNAGLGTVVHLAPNYLVSFHHYNNQSQLNGDKPDALAMFLNSVAFVSGAVSLNSATVQVTVNNVAPTVDTLVLSSNSIDENGTVAVSGSFTDAGIADTHTVMINWGDGTTSAAVVTQGAGSGTFTASHQYLDDNPTGTPQDPYTISVTATDDDSGVSAAATAVITVNNIAPTVASVNLSAAAIDENGSVTVSGSVTDVASLDTHTVTIDFGDGSAPVTVAVDPVSRTYSASHQYLDDNPTATASDPYTISVTATDDDGGVSATATAVITVGNVAPAVASVDLSQAAIDENGTVTVSGSVTDVGSLDTHTVTVDFGDGSAPVTVSVDPATRTYSASHQYLDDNPTATSSDQYTISVTATDDDGGVSAAASATITVNNVAPALDPLVLSSAVIGENGTVTVDGTLTDPGSLDTHQVVINWGDGSANTVITLTGAERAFSAAHQYLDDNPTGTPSDAYAISATVTDDDTGSAAASAMITVNNVAPAVDPLLLSSAVVDENGTVTVDGTFTDPGSLDTHQVVINWGDGSADTVITLTGAERSFSATHQYLDDNPTGTPSDTYTISATVTDDDTGSDSAAATITVNNVDPEISSLSGSATVCGAAGEGHPVTISGSFSDVGTLDTHTAVVDWGDGSPLENITVTETGGVGTFSGSHSYASGGIYTITVTLEDDDTGTDVATTSAVITGAGVNNGTLYVIGTDQADQVTVNKVMQGQSGSVLRVHASFLSDQAGYRDLSADVQKIVVVLCSGDDTATIAANVTTTAVIDGGAGNDHLNGGGGPNVIWGGDGDDTLLGAGGRDILIGGRGADAINGGGGEDILLAGGTIFDPNNAALSETFADSLLAILDEWRRTDLSYNDRVANIQGGVGLPAGVRLDSSTVRNDADVDELTGASGRDWFLAHSANDLVHDLNALDEVFTDINGFPVL